MKKVLKILGITAAVAALTPYRIHKDKETGEKKVEALLWRATAAPKDGEEKMTLDVSVGFQSPFASKSEYLATTIHYDSGCRDIARRYRTHRVRRPDLLHHTFVYHI